MTMPPSSPGTAIIAWFSMYSCSWWPTRYSPSRTRSAAAKPAAMSPCETSYWANTWSDCSGSNTGGRASVTSFIRPLSWRSVSRSGAASSATGSAWCRISPPTGTSSGWSSLIRLTTLSPGISAAVARTTFDQSTSGSGSIASSFARASVERIVMPYHAPGKTRSSVYFAAPVSFARPSRRSGKPDARPGTRWPGSMTRARSTVSVPGVRVRVGIVPRVLLAHRDAMSRPWLVANPRLPNDGPLVRLGFRASRAGAPRLARLAGRRRPGQARDRRAARLGHRQPGAAAVPGQGVHWSNHRVPDRAARAAGRLVALCAIANPVPGHRRRAGRPAIPHRRRGQCPDPVRHDRRLARPEPPRQLGAAHGRDRAVAAARRVGTMDPSGPRILLGGDERGPLGARRVRDVRPELPGGRDCLYRHPRRSRPRDDRRPGRGVGHGAAAEPATGGRDAALVATPR